MKAQVLFSLIVCAAGLNLQGGRGSWSLGAGECAGLVHVASERTDGGATPEKYCLRRVEYNFTQEPITAHNNRPYKMDGYTPKELLGGIFVQGWHAIQFQQSITLTLKTEKLLASADLYMWFNNGTAPEWDNKTHDFTGGFAKTLPNLGFTYVGGGPPYDTEAIAKHPDCEEWPHCHGKHSQMWTRKLTSTNPSVTIPIDGVNLENPRGSGAIYGMVVQGSCDVLVQHAVPKEWCHNYISAKGTVKMTPEMEQYKQERQEAQKKERKKKKEDKEKKAQNFPTEVVKKIPVVKDKNGKVVTDKHGNPKRWRDAVGAKKNDETEDVLNATALKKDVAEESALKMEQEEQAEQQEGCDQKCQESKDDIEAEDTEFEYQNKPDEGNSHNGM